jgi:hypothetical protein
MTVMPFILIIQLVMCGFMFVLPDYAEPVKEVTISKWGLTAICSSVDVEQYPNNFTLMKFEEAKALNPDFNDWKEAGIEQEDDPDYEAKTEHILTCWCVLFGYSLFYGAVGASLLKLVDKDKR